MARVVQKVADPWFKRSRRFREPKKKNEIDIFFID
jgi:hypothetical protein